MRTALILACSLAAFAQQPKDLATTRDGAVLYFTRQYFAAHGLDSTIYRWSADAGVTVFAERPDLRPPPPALGGAQLYGTQVTDGGAILFHAEPLCSTGLGPGFNTCTMGETQVMVPDREPFRVPAFLLVSPSGRYGVFAPYGKGALWTDWATGEEIEVEMESPYEIPGVAPPFSVNQYAVADNGSFLIKTTAGGRVGLRVWSKRGEVVLPATSVIEFATISADGSTVAITAADPRNPSPSSPSQVHDLASGRVTGFPGRVSLSEDGKTVAYLSGEPFQPPYKAQAMVARADGSGARQVTNAPDAVFSALLSRDGRYLFVTAGSPFDGAPRIERYELSTGRMEPIPGIP